MNYPFKDKFTANPQQDAEGFTVQDAKCVGCAPADMCPRSGHCERYMSPLRETHGVPAWMVNSVAGHEAALREHGAARLNPEGWREVDGVLLPHIAWGRAS